MSSILIVYFLPHAVDGEVVINDGDSEKVSDYKHSGGKNNN